MDIRLLSQEDAQELEEVMKVTWQETYPEFCEQESALLERLFNIEQIKNDLNEDKNYFFGAWDEGRLIGYAKVVIKTDSSFLDKIYVQTAFHRQGIGKQLLLRCCKEVIASGINSMGLEVDEKNTNAIGFYEKHGFKCNPIKRLFPSTGPELYYDYLMLNINLKSLVEKLETGVTAENTGLRVTC